MAEVTATEAVNNFSRGLDSPFKYLLTKGTTLRVSCNLKRLTPYLYKVKKKTTVLVQTETI